MSPEIVKRNDDSVRVIEMRLVVLVAAQQKIQEFWQVV